MSSSSCGPLLEPFVTLKEQNRCLLGEFTFIEKKHHPMNEWKFLVWRQSETMPRFHLLRNALSRCVTSGQALQDGDVQPRPAVSPLPPVSSFVWFFSRSSLIAGARIYDCVEPRIGTRDTKNGEVPSAKTARIPDVVMINASFYCRGLNWHRRICEWT